MGDDGLAEAAARRAHELAELVGYVTRSTRFHFPHIDEATARRCAATLVTLAGWSPELARAKRRCLEFVR